MAIEMLESNELAALSNSRLGTKSFLDEPTYQSFLGIGEGKMKAKRNVALASQQVLASTQADEGFKTKMKILYLNLKGVPNEKTIAQQQMDAPNGLDAVKQVIKLWGTPTPKSLGAHNTYVDVYTRYFIPDDSSTLDCSVLTTMAEQLTIELEETNQKKASGVSGSYLVPKADSLAAKLSQVKKLMSKQQCEAKAQKLATEESNKSTISTFEKLSEGGSSNTIKYGLYGLGGLILIGGLYILLKK